MVPLSVSGGPALLWKAGGRVFGRRGPEHRTLLMPQDTRSWVPRAAQPCVNAAYGRESRDRAGGRWGRVVWP